MCLRRGLKVHDIAATRCLCCCYCCSWHRGCCRWSSRKVRHQRNRILGGALPPALWWWVTASPKQRQWQDKMGRGAGIFWSHTWAVVCRYFPFPLCAETKMNFLFARAYSSTKFFQDMYNWLTQTKWGLMKTSVLLLFDHLQFHFPPFLPPTISYLSAYVSFVSWFLTFEQHKLCTFAVSFNCNNSKRKDKKHLYFWVFDKLTSSSSEFSI